MVKKSLGTTFVPELCMSGVVLTGGTSKLPGIAECASKVFGVPAHVGEAPANVSENLRDPGFSTALGLLYYGLSSQAESAAPTARRKTGFLQKLFAGV